MNGLPPPSVLDIVAHQPLGRAFSRWPLLPIWFKGGLRTSTSPPGGTASARRPAGTPRGTAIPSDGNTDPHLTAAAGPAAPTTPTAYSSSINATKFTGAVNRHRQSLGLAGALHRILRHPEQLPLPQRRVQPSAGNGN